MERCVRGAGTGMGLMAVVVVTPDTSQVVAWTVDRDGSRMRLTRFARAEPC